MKYTSPNLDKASGVSGCGNGPVSPMVIAHSEDSAAAVTAASGSVSVLRRLARLLKQLSYLEKVALTAVCVLAMIVLVLACLLYNANASAAATQRQLAESTSAANTGPNNTCTHPVCVQLTARLLSNMNESADPCDDFYEFACGSFRQRMAIPAGRHRVNVFSVQSSANEILLRSLLESASPYFAANADVETELEANAAALYLSCMNDTAREAVGVQPLLDLLAPVGPWSAYNATSEAYRSGGWDLSDGLRRAVAFSVAHWEMPPFFSLGVMVDAFNSKRRAVHLSQPHTLLLRDDYAENRTANLQALSDSLLDIARLFGLNMSSGDAADIVELERNIAKFKASMPACAISDTTDMHLPQFSLPEWRRRDTLQIVNASVRDLMANFPCINWTDLLRTVLENSNYNLNDDTPVNIYDKPYFDHLCTLINDLAKSPQQTRLANNYLLLRAIWSFLPFTTPQANHIATSLISRLRGVHGSESPWQRCVKSVNSLYRYPLGKLFVDRHFRGESRASVQRLIDSLTETFNASLTDATWMDSGTRRSAIGKLLAIRQLVGYPDYFDNATALRMEWGGYRLLPDQYFQNAVLIQRMETIKALKKLSEPVHLTFDMSPQSVNAYYSPSFNAIAFPAGILQEPFYRPQFPAYAAYGAIGAVIGHEITHGFDDNGRHYDSEGNRREWWSNSTAAAFDKATDCIVRQYEAFTVDGDVRVGGRLVLGESIADNGGLKMAYRAYKKQQSDREQLLPYLGERYTREQLLFVAYAQTWCELVTPESLRHMITANPHPPGQMRVWGPVANLPEFGRAFRCQAGARMNPTEKCTVW